MKTTLRAEVELWELATFAELAVWARRPELQRVLAAVPEGGLLTAREIDRALPGLSSTANRNVLKHLTYLRLTNDRGGLTPLGVHCVTTGEAPTWELGVFAFLVALHPLFRRQVLGFRRLEVDQRDLNFDSLQLVPEWFEAEPTRAWTPAFDGLPAFTVYALAAPRSGAPRCRLSALDPARLVWDLDLVTGMNSWRLEGSVGDKGERTAFRAPPQSVAADAVRGMFAGWDSRWDAKATRLAMTYDLGATGGRDTFERTLRYSQVLAGEAGTFHDVEVEGIPVGPSSAAEAQRWALDLVLARVEAADAFCTIEDWRTHWTAAISGTPLQSLAGPCPDPEGAARPDGKPLRSRTRWLLIAAHDLGVA